MEFRELVERRVSVRQFRRSGSTRGRAARWSASRDWRRARTTRSRGGSSRSPGPTLLQRDGGRRPRQARDAPPRPGDEDARHAAQRSRVALDVLRGRPAGRRGRCALPYRAVIQGALDGSMLTNARVNAMRGQPDIQSVGAAVEHLLLAATDMGYGGMLAERAAGGPPGARAVAGHPGRRTAWRRWSRSAGPDRRSAGSRSEAARRDPARHRLTGRHGVPAGSDGRMPCAHVSESWRSSRNLDLHPGINFSKLEIGGDVGGLVFAAGSVAGRAHRPALDRADVPGVDRPRRRARGGALRVAPAPPGAETVGRDGEACREPRVPVRPAPNAQPLVPSP